MPATHRLALVIEGFVRTGTKFATLSQRGVFDRSDQINQNSRAYTVPPRGTGQTDSKASLNDVERSGRRTSEDVTTAKLALFLCDVNGSGFNHRLHQILVEPDGIEPTTSCLQSTRSPN